jgi:hypothetical protein
LGLQVGLLPGTNVKRVVEILSAKDDAVKGAFFHFADVIPNEIRIWDVPTIFDDFLSGPLLSAQLGRKKPAKYKGNRTTQKQAHSPHGKTPSSHILQ